MVRGLLAKVGPVPTTFRKVHKMDEFNNKKTYIKNIRFRVNRIGKHGDYLNILIPSSYKQDILELGRLQPFEVIVKPVEVSA